MPTISIVTATSRSGYNRDGWGQVVVVLVVLNISRISSLKIFLDRSLSIIFHYSIHWDMPFIPFITIIWSRNIHFFFFFRTFFRTFFLFFSFFFKKEKKKKKKKKWIFIDQIIPINGINNILSKKIFNIFLSNYFN